MEYITKNIRKHNDFNNINKKLECTKIKLREKIFL